MIIHCLTQSGYYGCREAEDTVAFRILKKKIIFLWYKLIACHYHPATIIIQILTTE